MKLVKLQDGVYSCPLCGAPIQRLPGKPDARSGIKAHAKLMHPGELLPTLELP